MKFIIMFLFCGLLYADVSYDLSYDEGKGKAIDVTLLITVESGWAVKFDKCYGTIYDSEMTKDEIVEATRVYSDSFKEEILLSTTWDKCFSGMKPADVIGNLLMVTKGVHNAKTKTSNK
jgi:hypothetical protein